MHGDPRGLRYLRSPNAFGRTQEAGALEPASPDTAAHGQRVHPEWAPILLARSKAFPGLPSMMEETTG